MQKIKEFLTTTPGKVAAGLAAVLVAVFIWKKTSKRR